MDDTSLVIEQRFCGPPNSANGGYAAGRLASFLDGGAAVTLHRPPPLDVPLTVRCTDDDHVALLDGSGVVVASAVGAELDIDPFAAPDTRQAAAAAGRTFPSQTHALPTCFVCGPLRDHGDGLRIHVGPLDPDDRDWNGVLAAPWVPAGNLADEGGTVREEFVWAALDCPTAYACGNADGMGPILLGRQTLKIERCPLAGEHCIVTSVFRGRERRKLFAESTLFGADGERLASCRAIWIEVSEAVQKGAA